MSDMMDGMGGMWLWMAIPGLAAAAVLTVLVIAAIRVVNGRNADDVQGVDPAEDILRRRFAAGELSEDEYYLQSTTLRRDGAWSA